MAKYLINETKVYRFDTDKEAQNFVNGCKKSGYEVISSKIERRSKKAKGEIIDEWTRLTLKLKYNDEKEPDELTDTPWEIPDVDEE